MSSPSPRRFQARRLPETAQQGRPRGPARSAIAYWIQRRLCYLRWSNKHLAETMRVDVMNVDKWVRGVREPRADNLSAIARALGVTSDHLLQPLPEGVTLPATVTEETSQGRARDLPKQREPEPPAEEGALDEDSIAESTIFVDEDE